MPYDPSRQIGFVGCWLAKEAAAGSIPEHFGGSAGTYGGSAVVDATALDGYPGIKTFAAGQEISLPVSFAGARACSFLHVWFDRTRTNGFKFQYTLGGAPQALYDQHYLDNHSFTRVSTGHGPITVQHEEINGGTDYPITLGYRTDSARVGRGVTGAWAGQLNDQYQVRSDGRNPPDATTTYSGITDNADVLGAAPMVIPLNASSGVWGGVLAFTGALSDAELDAAARWLQAQVATPYVLFAHMGDSIAAGVWRDALQALFDARADKGKTFRAIGPYGTAPSSIWAQAGLTTQTLTTAFTTFGLGVLSFPQRILLLIGANDITVDSVTAAQLATRVGTLLTTINGLLPGVQIVLQRPLPMIGGKAAYNPTVLDYVNNYFDGVVSTARAAGVAVTGSGTFRQLCLDGKVNQTDGEHPDAVSAPVIAEAMYPEICAMVGLLVQSAAALPGSPTLLTQASGISGSPIDSWANDGSAGHSLTGSGTARPAQTTVDGRIAALFDGVNDALVSPGSLTVANIAPASAYTLCGVIRATTLADSSAPGIVGAQILTSNNGYWTPMVARAAGICAGHWTAIGAIFTPQIAITAGVLYVYRVVYDGTTLALTINGKTVTVAAGNRSLGDTDILFMSKSADFATFQPCTIAELVAYGSALSVGDQAVADSYLRALYPSAV